MTKPIFSHLLTNVGKHAQAKQVIVSLETMDEKVCLTIADNGVGFDPEAHHKPGAQPEWGLITMRERAEGIGGKLHIKTAPGKGTKVIVEVVRNK